MSAPTDAPVALVPGGIRGLGLACARRLIAGGTRAHVVWRSSEDRARALEAELGSRIHRADVLEPGEAQRLVADVVRADGRLDRLVHAVGEYESGPLAEVDAAGLQRMLRSNVESFLNVVNAARPHLRAARGRIVCFGFAGLDGLRARRTAAAYAAAKSALLVLVRSLAVEEAPHGVTVNMVSPGMVPHDAAHADTLDEDILRRIPAGRAGDPEDVAAAVEWLCSDAAAYTTGSNLVVSGGWML